MYGLIILTLLVDICFGQSGPITTEEPFTIELFTTTNEPFTTTDEPFTTTDEPFTTTDEPFTTTDEPFTTTMVPFTPAPLCFSEDTTVSTSTGTKTMKDLNIGDYVLSYGESHYVYSPVISFLHRYEHKQAAFLFVSAGDHNVTITPLHFIYSMNCDNTNDGRSIEMKYAKDLQVGNDCLLLKTNDNNSRLPFKLVPVTSVTKVIRNGIYGPMTANSNFRIGFAFKNAIIVNDLIVSCHAIIRDDILLYSMLKLSRNIESILNNLKGWFGFAAPTHMYNEMPTALENMLHYSDIIFIQNWKSIGQQD